MNIIDKREQSFCEAVPKIGEVFTFKDPDNTKNIYIRANPNDYMIIKPKKDYIEKDYILIFNLTSNYIGYATLEELNEVRILDYELAIKEKIEC